MDITKVKNIIISGTNFWNPGDDFVRDGIIEVLKRLFKGYKLNFLFYNFNQDFFPQNKFSGIVNMVAKGDLNQYGQFVDAIVIAGLSAGNEIKDLYNWIIENGLHDRVYLIGAGYENTYVDYHIYKEPEVTIFKHAKVITGRTRKTPKFISDWNLLYYHINCPAILSVKQVKTIPPGKKIEKIGFSIQLPHEVGVSNHCCDEKMYRLSLDILMELSETYEVDIIGHHKSEYVHFLNLFRGKIPVIFSSYYQDLFDIYPDYDLFITTRLHSSLFANGHGIPGIILNDTDRHTHCLEGFPHSVWVDNKEKFYKEFEKFCKSDLCKIAEESRNFKENLMNRYIEVLAKPFGIELREKDALSSELDKDFKDHRYFTGLPFKPPFDKLLNFLDISSKDVIGKEKLLPIHFFTIVLNGEPFIRYHMDIFKKLPFKWHWHIIEGVADLKHDTAWSLHLGGHITDELHSMGLSNDGTSEYIDLVAREFPCNVTVYRKPYNMFWDGKLEMVNAPLVNIHEECLLWQIDVDEFWTSEQIFSVRELFAKHPEKTSAFYLCHYFVGEKLVITTRNTYGNHTDYEWLRTWRFKPGYTWITHEPPGLCGQNCDGQWIDISTINPFLHKDTESKNLIFQHYAYVIEKQLRFKELYYGYKNAAIQWKKLQEEKKYPLLLKYYFDWVHDETQVNTIYSQNIIPLLDINKDKKLYRDVYITSNKVLNILWIRTDSIGDNILASSMLPYIRYKYKNATITVLCQKHIRELYEPCPFIDNIITFEKSRVYREECYRNKIIQKLKKLKPEISFNSVYSREPLTDVFSINCEARYTIAFNGDFANGMTEEIRQKNNRLYTTILSNDGEYKPELERHRDFLRNIGINVADIKPLVWITEKDEQFARDLFCKYNLHTEKTIVLFAGALVPVRLYKYYGKALTHVFKNNNITVIALGIDKDYEVSQSNLQDTGVNIINLCGKTTLRESAAIMKRCHLAIGAETGLAHLACAVGVRNVVILGGGHFGRFMPYSPLTSVVCLPLECYVCNWHCKYQNPYCVHDIIPEVFAAATIQTIKKSSDKPRIFVQGKSLWRPSGNQPDWALFDKYLNINNFDIITIDDISTNEIENAEAFLLVNQLRETGLLEEALISSEEIIRKYPDSPELLNLQAEIKYQMGNIEEAKNSFLELSVRFSDHSQILNNLGVIYLQEGCPEKALEYYRKSLHVNPDNRVATLNLADLMITLNNIDEAERILYSYIERHKDDELIPGFLDSVKERKKEKVVVSETLEEIKEIMKDGELDLARLALKGLLCDHPDNPELLHLQDLINAQRKTSCQIKK